MSYLGVSEPIGLEDGTFPIASVSASSNWSNEWHISSIRLNGPRCWHSASGQMDNQWVVFDLGTTQVITAIQLQGRADMDQWTTQFKVSGSDDGTAFVPYQDSTGTGVFDACSDRLTVETIEFQPPLISQYIRVEVVAYVHYPGFRAEIHVIPRTHAQFRAAIQASGIAAQAVLYPLLKTFASDECTPRKKFLVDRVEELHDVRIEIVTPDSSGEDTEAEVVQILTYLSFLTAMELELELESVMMVPKEESDDAKSIVRVVVDPSKYAVLVSWFGADSHDGDGDQEVLSSQQFNEFVLQLISLTDFVKMNQKALLDLCDLFRLLGMKKMLWMIASDLISVLTEKEEVSVSDAFGLFRCCYERYEGSLRVPSSPIVAGEAFDVSFASVVTYAAFVLLRNKLNSEFGFGFGDEEDGDSGESPAIMIIDEGEFPEDIRLWLESVGLVGLVREGLNRRLELRTHVDLGLGSDVVKPVSTGLLLIREFGELWKQKNRSSVRVYHAGIEEEEEGEEDEPGEKIGRVEALLIASDLIHQVMASEAFDWAKFLDTRSLKLEELPSQPCVRMILQYAHTGSLLPVKEDGLFPFPCLFALLDIGQKCSDDFFIGACLECLDAVSDSRSDTFMEDVRRYCLLVDDADPEIRNRIIRRWVLRGPRKEDEMRDALGKAAMSARAKLMSETIARLEAEIEGMKREAVRRDRLIGILMKRAGVEEED